MYYHLPTGTGKTRVAAALIQELLKYGRVIFLAHRKELITQAAASLRQDLPGWQIGTVMAGENQIHADVVVASVQTLASGDRLEQLLASDGKLDAKSRFVGMLIDECHHAVPGSGYDRIMTALTAHTKRAAIIGCTATPYRADKAVMQGLLPTCTFSRTIKAMQIAGVLAPVTWSPVHVGVDFSHLKSSSRGGESDYAEEDIARVLQPRLEEIVEKTAPLLGNRPTVVFAATVAQAKDLASLYREVGLRALSIWGEMAVQDRRQALTLWKQGNVQIVVNVGILTEGFDYQPELPNTEGLAAMVIARPTKSPGLYLQMLGRGTRPKPGEYQDCLVIDIAGNANLIESKQIVLPKALGEPVSEEIYGILENPVLLDDLRNVDCSRDLDVDDLGVVAKEKRPIILRNTDPLSRSWLAWGKSNDTYYTDLMQGSMVLLALEERSGLYTGRVLTRQNWVFTGDQPLTDNALPLHELMQHVNLLVAAHGVPKQVVGKDAGWRQQLASEKAISYLARLDPDAGTQARRHAWNKHAVGMAITAGLLREGKYL